VPYNEAALECPRPLGAVLLPRFGTFYLVPSLLHPLQPLWHQPCPCFIP